MARLEWTGQGLNGEAWLVFVKNQNVYMFEGMDIPSITKVIDRHFSPSGTAYSLDVLEGVTTLFGTGSVLEAIPSHFNGVKTFTWASTAKALGIKEETMKTFLHRYFPKDAAWLDNQLVYKSGSQGLEVVVWNNTASKIGQRPWLILVKDGQLYKFFGENIPNVLEVHQSLFKNFPTNNKVFGKHITKTLALQQNLFKSCVPPKNPKSGSTTFSLKIYPRTQVLSGEGSFLEKVTDAFQTFVNPQPASTWANLAKTLNVNEETVKTFLHRFFPKEAEAFEEKQTCSDTEASTVSKDVGEFKEKESDVNTKAPTTPIITSTPNTPVTVLNPEEMLQQKYVALVEHWGQEQRIIETAYGHFFGWDELCPTCYVPLYASNYCRIHGTIEKPKKGDRKLLAILYKRQNPFFFNTVGFAVKIKAPSLVAVEWLCQQAKCYPLMKTTQHEGLADTVVMPVTAGLWTWLQFIQQSWIDAKQPVRPYVDTIKYIVKQMFPETYALACAPMETSSTVPISP